MTRAVILILLLMAPFLQAQTAEPKPFILHNEEIVLEKAAEKMEEMMSELYDKTGIAIYLSAIARLPEGHTITTYEQELAQQLDGSFVLIAVSRTDQQIDLIASEDLVDRFDKDELLRRYIIPFFVEQRRDVTPQQQMSAGLLNGIAHITDHFAAQEDVILLSSIGAESENFIKGLMLVIKIMLGLTVLAFFIAWYRSQ